MTPVTTGLGGNHMDVTNIGYRYGKWAAYAQPGGPPQMSGAYR